MRKEEQAQEARSVNIRHISLLSCQSAPPWGGRGRRDVFGLPLVREYLRCGLDELCTQSMFVFLQGGRLGSHLPICLAGKCEIVSCGGLLLRDDGGMARTRTEMLRSNSGNSSSRSVIAHTIGAFDLRIALPRVVQLLLLSTCRIDVRVSTSPGRLVLPLGVQAT